MAEANAKIKGDTSSLVKEAENAVKTLSKLVSTLSETGKANQDAGKASVDAGNKIADAGKKAADAADKQARLGIAYEKAIISAKLAADRTKDAADALKTASTTAGTTTDQINKLSLAYQKAAVESQSANQKVKDTSKALTDAGGSTAAYANVVNALSRTTLPDAAKETKKVSTATGNDLTKDLQKAGQAALEAGKKLVSFGIDAGQKAFDGVQKLAGAAEKAVATLAKIGLAAGAAATAAGGGALKLASDYESAFADLKVAISPLERTEENFKALEAAAVRVGIQTKFSSKEAALGLSELAAAGLNTEQSIKAVDAVAQAAAINHVDMAEAAKTMTVAMNAFGISAEDTTRIIDVQTKAANLGVMKFQDFQMGLAAGGAVAKMANQSFEDFSASLVVLTNNGLSASDAGTSMKSALLQLVSPGMQAQSAIDELGLSVRDTQGNVRPFVDIIAQIEHNTKGMTKETKDFYLANLGGSDGVRAYASALQARVEIERDGKKVTLEGSEAIRYFQDQLKNSSGSAKDAAAILQTTLGAKVENLKGSFEQFGITIGTALLEPSKKVVDQLSKFVNKALEAELANHKISNAITTVVGKVENFAGKAFDLYQKLSPIVTILNPLKMGMEILGGVMSGGVAGGFKAVEDQVIKVGKAFGFDLGDAIDGFNITVAEKVIPNLKEIGNWFEKHVIPLVGAFGKTFEKDILPALGRFGDFLNKEVFPALGEFFDWFGVKIVPVLGKVVAVVMDDVVPTLFSWWEVLATFLQPIIESVAKFIEEDFIPNFSKLAKVIDKDVMPILKNVAGFLGGTLGVVFGVIGKIIGGIIDIVGRLAGTISAAVKGDWGGAWDAITGKTKGVGDATADLQKKNEDMLNQLKTVGKTTLADHTKAVDTLSTKFKDSKKPVDDFTAAHDALIKKVNGDYALAVNEAKKKTDELSKNFKEGKISPDEYKNSVAEINKKLMEYKEKTIDKKKFEANFTDFNKGLDGVISKLGEVAKKMLLPPMQWQTVGSDGKITTSYTPPSGFPVPAHAAGTMSARPGLALVGEKGAELIQGVNGKLALALRPMLINLAGGERIFNADQTSAMLPNPASPTQISNMYQNSNANSWDNSISNSHNTTNQYNYYGQQTSRQMSSGMQRVWYGRS